MYPPSSTMSRADSSVIRRASVRGRSALLHLLFCLGNVAWLSAALAVQPAKPPLIFKPEAIIRSPALVRPVNPEVQLRQVPAVTGMSEARARSTLESAGFMTGSVSRVASRAAAGIVVSQSVAPGTRHDPREPIGLQISRGQKPETEVYEPPAINPELLKPGVVRPTEPAEPPQEPPPPRDDVQPEPKVSGVRRSPGSELQEHRETVALGVGAVPADRRIRQLAGRKYRGAPRSVVIAATVRSGTGRAAGDARPPILRHSMIGIRFRRNQLE